MKINFKHWHTGSARRLAAGLWVAVFLGVVLASAAPAFVVKAAPRPSVYDLLAAVNQLRAANGLAPYNANDALMSAAQSHSAYQASIGTITHDGQGGSRPRDRAAAFGYGAGGTFYVSENIAGGNGLTAAQAVVMWQGDSLHLNTMLNPAAVDAGAGMAESGGFVYFTLDAGYVAGQGGGAANPTSPGQAPAVPVGTPGTPLPTARPFNPVTLSTPNPDGSIVHVVKTGQALWNIAAVYKIPLADLLKLNNLTENSFIHPGDKLLIRAGDGSALPSATMAATVTVTATLTTSVVEPALSPLPPRKTSTLAPRKSPPPITPTATPVPEAAPASGTGGMDPILIVILSVGGLGAILLLLGTVTRRPPGTG